MFQLLVKPKTAQLSKMMKGMCWSRGESRILLIAGLFVCVWLICMNGCNQDQNAVKEAEERAYRRAKSLQREGRFQEALGAFLEVIDERKMAPESHLEAGLIYLERLQSPLSSIYHFNRYLEVRPQGEQSDYVRDLISTAQKEYLKQLPGDPFGNDIQRFDYSKKLTEVQNEVRGLKELLAQSEQARKKAEDRVAVLEDVQRDTRGSSGSVASIVVAPPSTSREPADHPHSYTVAAGDTLSRISTKVYGSSGRWMDIFQANRDTLSSPNALKVGQELRIP